MATLLHAVGYSTIGNTKYDLYLDNGAPSALAVNIEISGLIIDHKADEKDIDAPLLPGKVSVDFVVDQSNTDHISALEAMEGAAEGTFRLRVERNGVLDFIGFVLLDLLTIQDTSGKFNYKISATDGLARLKTIDYTGGGVYYDDYASVRDHLQFILQQIPMSDYFGVGDEYYRINATLWPDGLAPSDTIDQTGLTRCSYRAFRTIDRQGAAKFSSCYTVLTELCDAFGLRITFSRGSFKITDTVDMARQVGATTYQTYQYDGTAIGVDVVNLPDYQRTVSNSDDFYNSGTGITVAGGNITFRPALREVKWTYQHYSKQNVLPGDFVWSNVQNAFATIPNFRTAPGLVMRISTDLELSIDTESEGTNSALPYYVVFEATLAISNPDENVDSLTRDYAITTGGVNYSNEQWINEVGAGTYPIIVKVDPFEGTFQSRINILTPEVPSDGTLTFRLVIREIRRGGQIVSVPSLTYLFFNPYISTFIEGSVTDQYNFSNFSSQNVGFAGNSQIQERTVLLGDGPTVNTFGRLEYFDGTAWQVTDGWRKYVNGAYQDAVSSLHGARRAADLLALQDRRRQNLNSTIVLTDYAPHMKLIRAGRVYIATSTSADLLSDNWRGEWVEIAYAPASASVPEEQPSNDDPNTGTTPNDDGFGNSEGGSGVVAGEVIPPGQLAPGLTTVTTGLDGQIPEGVPSDTIPVQATPIDLPLYEGDVIVITNPSTGQQETVIVAYDSELGVPAAAQDGTTPNSFPYYTATGLVWLVPDDTNVAVEGFTPGVTMPEDSFLQFNAAYLTRLRSLLRIDHVDAHLFDFTAPLTVGFTGWFWRPGRRTGWHIRRVHFAFATAGTGRVKINLKYYDATGFRYTIVTHDATGGLGTVQNAAAVVQDGYYRPEIEIVEGTPPQGLQMIIEYVKILPS